MKFQYLPWLRSGLAARLTDEFATSLPTDPEIEMAAELTGGAAPSSVARKVRLRGPGHVIGLPAGAVRRVAPAPAEVTAPTTHFPQVELPATLPWAYTPAAPNGGKLPPWLVLVVVRADVGQLIRLPDAPLPVLRLPAQAGAELPVLDDAWAWAHVQVPLVDDQTPEDVLEARPEAAVARLLCPRRLAGGVRYIAALVPTFAAGRQAGLGQVVTATKLEWAWTRAAVDASGIDLPVYHAWQFTTIAVGTGDFEDLAGKLQTLPPNQYPVGLGVRDVTVVDEGGAMLLKPPAPGSFKFRGALGTEARPAPQADGSVADALLATWQKASAAADPIAAPPLVGAMQTVADPDPVLALNDPKLPWLRAVNLDPGLRAAAGLGAEIVRRNQDDLLASAWAQVADLRRVNRALECTALAAEVGRSLGRKVRKLSPGEQLQLTRGAHATIRVADGTVRELVARTSLPDGLLSAAMRRAVRPGGALGRRLNAGKRAYSPAGPVAGLFVASVVDPADKKYAPLRELADAAPADSKLQGALVAVTETLKDRRTLLTARLAARMPAELSPRVARPGLPLAPLRARPVFAEPLVHHLTRLSPDLLLPGLSELAEDSVLLLRQDRAFVAALLAGANDAMARELVWREYPFDPAWTFFRQFWERGVVSAAGEVKEGIRGWGIWPPAPGEAAAADSKVLLVKAALLRRFPGTHIYGWNEKKAEARTPLFAGSPVAGVAYAGFVKDPGESWDDWWFVLEQPASEPTFGLDSVEPAPKVAPKGPDDLCWQHFGVVADGFVPLLRPNIVPKFPGLEWGSSSAALARLTLQKPVRFAVPAKTWL